MNDRWRTCRLLWKCSSEMGGNEEHWRRSKYCRPYRLVFWTNFGVNNFSIHPKYLPLSKIRHDVGLHMICSTCRKVLYVFRQHVDRYSYDNVIFEIFNMLWENTFYRNQFRYCEVLSHIDGSHVTKLINNTNDLVSLIKTECEDIVCLIHMCQLLLLLPKLTKFWKKVKIDSSFSCAEETK